MRAEIAQRHQAKVEASPPRLSEAVRTFFTPRQNEGYCHNVVCLWTFTFSTLFGHTESVYFSSL